MVPSSTLWEPFLFLTKDELNNNPDIFSFFTVIRLLSPTTFIEFQHTTSYSCLVTLLFEECKIEIFGSPDNRFVNKYCTYSRSRQWYITRWFQFVSTFIVHLRCWSSSIRVLVWFSCFVVLTTDFHLTDEMSTTITVVNTN